MYIQKVSTPTRQVLSLAQKHHWGFRVVGSGGMIDNPVYQEGWWFFPLKEDKSIIPTKAFQRVEEVRSKNHIQGLIVAHDFPKLLPAPLPQTKPITIEKPEKEIDFDKDKAVATLGAVVGAVLVGLATLVGIVLITGIQLILIDPSLIVVLEDGTWVSVYSWLE